MVLGVVFGLVLTGVAWLLPEPMKLPLLAGLLWLTVGWYLGMAAMDKQELFHWQVVGGLPIVALLILGIETPILIVVAWLLHPAWDLLHHVGAIKTRIHPATVPFCITFDLVMAGATLGVVQGWL